VTFFRVNRLARLDARGALVWLSRWCEGADINLLDTSDRVARLAAVLAAIGFIALAGFQAALAAGAPWGRAAWGGGDSQLSSAQRGASAVAAVVYVAAALVVLGRAGMLGAEGNMPLFRWGIWFLVFVMAIGAIPNFISQSRWENFIFGPLAIVLAVLCVVVARSSPPGPTRG
jgi:hypothetical protein